MCAFVNGIAHADGTRAVHWIYSAKISDEAYPFNFEVELLDKLRLCRACHEKIRAKKKKKKKS
jgi:hypothetical protein